MSSATACAASTRAQHLIRARRVSGGHRVSARRACSAAVSPTSAASAAASAAASNTTTLLFFAAGAAAAASDLFFFRPGSAVAGSTFAFTCVSTTFARAFSDDPAAATVRGAPTGAAPTGAAFADARVLATCPALASTLAWAAAAPTLADVPALATVSAVARVLVVAPLLAAAVFPLDTVWAFVTTPLDLLGTGVLPASLTALSLLLAAALPTLARAAPSGPPLSATSVLPPAFASALAAAGSSPSAPALAA
mmetsp:Transcript_54257/g.169516  ORF Transcript_54257/g.169516 Transcript_54257/m.169516 type:complete len:252 (+) Transcript_54257:786-1541(+)